MKNHKEYLLYLAQRSRRPPQENTDSDGEVKFFEYQDNDHQFVRKDSKVMDEIQEKMQQQDEEVVNRPDTIEEVKELEEMSTIKMGESKGKKGRHTFT